MQNNEKIALIEHRTGSIDAIPESLNQSEIGFAYDANRLFIGNPNNEELSLRRKFPYQNVEILTEFSDLLDFIQYRYTNNIFKDGEVTDREKLIERVPIFIRGSQISTISKTQTVNVNGVDIELEEGMNASAIANVFNSVTEQTKITVYVIQPSSLYFLVNDVYFDLHGEEGIVEELGLPTDYQNESELLPYHKLEEKLNDHLHITDFGIKPNTDNDCGDILYRALLEVYNKFPTNKQAKREVYFPAGEYVIYSLDNVSLSLPLASGTKLVGEGIDSTILRFDYGFNNYAFQTVDSKSIFASSVEYNTDKVENIVISDMTINCQGGKGVALLKNASNVLFKNVRFICSATGLEFKTEDGKETKNITFENCVFEKGNNQISFDKNTSDIKIFHNIFKDAKQFCILIGEEGNQEYANILKVKVSDNIFESYMGTKTLNGVFGNAKYVSFTHSTFDPSVAEYQTILPFNEDFNNSGKNFTDTLNPTTDTNKYLRFSFTQPVWSYINKFFDDDGNLLVNSHRNGELPESDKLFVDVNVNDESSEVQVSINGNPETANFNLVNEKGDIGISSSANVNVIANSTIDLISNGAINTSSTEDTTISAHEGIILNSDEGHIDLNSYGEINLKSETDEINIKSVLDLNGNAIRSEDSNIILQVENDKVVEINDVHTEETPSYSERAIDNKDALVTTQMLKDYQSTIYGYSTSANIDDNGNLVLYDCSKYHSDSLIFKKLDVNFLVPPLSGNGNVKNDDFLKYVNNTAFKKYDQIVINGNKYYATTDFTAVFTTNKTKYDNIFKTFPTLYKEDGTPYEDDDITYKTINMRSGISYKEMYMDGIKVSNDGTSVIEGITYYTYTNDVEIEEEVYKYVLVKESDVSYFSDDDFNKIVEEEIENEAVVSGNVKSLSVETAINSFDILIEANDSYYVLGREIDLLDNSHLICKSDESHAMAGKLNNYYFGNFYESNNLMSFQGNFYKCLNDERTSITNYYGWKLTRIEDGVNCDCYTISLNPSEITAIYAENGDIFENIVVKDAEGVEVSQEIKDVFLFDVLTNISSIFNDESELYSKERKEELDHFVESELYKINNELFNRITKEDKFKRIALKGNSFSFEGGMGVFKTSSKISGSVVEQVNLEELALSNCKLSIRFFDRNGNHISLRNNDDDILNMKIGYFVEVVR